MDVKNKTLMMEGVGLLVLGLVLLYFGFEFDKSNLETLANPTLIKAALLYLGWIFSGLGILAGLVSLVKE